jgi:succinoglycan biosynthesis protein ExoA
VGGGPTGTSVTLVTVVMACRDEEARVEACVRAAQEQDWPADQLEILVADAMSIDATREILARLAAEDGRIVLIDNPARVQAAGLNECIRRARGDILVRMDVHADYGHDFVRKCVEVLDSTGADNVSGSARPKPRSFFQRCVAAALTSPLGRGGSQYRGAGTEGDVENVWPGAFRRAVFDRVGTFDPNAIANEDAELSQRIVEAGGRVYLSRDIVVHYHPRGSMRSLARHYFRRGQGSARTLLKHGRFLSWRPALPFAWLASEALLLATTPWQPLGTWSLATYLLVTGAEAVRVGRGEGVAAIPVVWAIFPVLHVSHGAGFAAGLVRYALRPDWGRDPPPAPEGHS